MLNRKLSNYLYYFVLAGIAIGVFLIRSATIGGIDTKISNLERDNLVIQAKINAIEEVVEDNNDIQIDHLYELYSQVPSTLSITELTYYTTAQLELIGITEEADIQRSVVVNPGITFSEGTNFALLLQDFRIVEVQVFFTTQDDAVIAEFVDLLYNADQVFIIHELEYNSPDGENFIGVTISFLAFYEKEDAS